MKEFNKIRFKRIYIPGRYPRSFFMAPKVGDGVTIYGYSDAYACTVVERKGNTVSVQRDNAELLNGFNSGEPDALKSYPGGFSHHVEGRQRYAYSRNPDGDILKYSRRKNGKWVRVGDSIKGQSIGMGRHEHYDYNF